ncbi:MAG: hypothetical protein AVO39_03605 [delta proteobacterium MLS_D]|jgi:diadenylate cyclase|nr:MAG: hypothetical protein AVO39_03605 [delta proteobacterium MLS_D]
MKEYMLHLINNIRVSDILDIGVITVLIYVILSWMKKTASRFVFFGIIILSMVYTAARFFHMYLTEYVLRGFFAVFLIALLIIFQEDLRRFFERLAIWRPRSRERASVTSPTEPLVTAIMRLARKRRGALIIIKGRDHLDRHLEGGVALDGEVSTALIESLFDTNSPGHDGAVVIDNGRAKLFSCHLPLSRNSLKVAGLGLRHTAALGLSELADALCIVVSEERGTVSVAMNGTIRTLVNPEDIKGEIDAFYRLQSPERAERGRRLRVTANPWEKGIALGLAAVLWLVFGFQTESIRRDFTIPVSYRNLPVNWIIESQDPREATVSLTGPKQAFDLFDRNTLRVIVDMSDIREGSQEIPLTSGSVEYPSNLTVVDIQPATLRLTAHELVPRDVSVQVQTTGILREDLVLEGIEVSPEKVKVLAKRQSDDDLCIVTEPIALDTITETTRLSPGIVQQAGLFFVDRRPPALTVVIKVARKEPAGENTPEETPAGASENVE